MKRPVARDQLLGLLSARPMTTTELVVKGKLPALAACVELRQLRAQGLISSATRGCEMVHSLAGSLPQART